jgi:hypothetical protein
MRFYRIRKFRNWFALLQTSEETPRPDDGALEARDVLERATFERVHHEHVLKHNCNFK